MGERRVALVTAGAGAGIGGAIVKELAAGGWEVAVTDAHERRCRELSAALEQEHGRPFLGIPLDVTDYDAVAKAVERVVDTHGGLDAIVNNAGQNKLEPLIEMSPDTWQRTIDVDLTGTFNCIRLGAPALIERGGGAIVNISSIAAWETSTEHGVAYSAAKAGVTALTRVAAAELGEHGIRVNAIAPGLIYNDFLLKVYPAEFFDGYAERRSRVGRVGRPEDVAALAAFLLSDRAGYITGEVYGISGGVLPHA
ncbi:MAG: 3-oxoacyl-[acyl-carrier protein] reductase [Thermoleophilaceae bacterium]|nr:3-oxoacyl-[acyl-carrier protein] reductase [Thermoleophilaceae bacterium]